MALIQRLRRTRRRRLNKNVFKDLDDLQGDNALDYLLEYYGSVSKGKKAKVESQGNVEDKLRGVEFEKTDCSIYCCF